MEAIDSRVDVVLPEMGESVTEGTITKWLVRVGDIVELDDPLVEVSTDKVDAELPSPCAGTVVEILCQEGDVVAVDEVLAVLSTTGDSAATTRRDAAPTARPAATDSDPAVADVTVAVVEPEPRVLATPLARKIAAREGLDLTTITGRGMRGQITRADVEQALGPPPDKASAESSGQPSPPASIADSRSFAVAPWVKGETVTLEPMSRIRRLTAKHMVYSQQTSVHVTTVFHADFTKVAATRARSKQRFQPKHGTKLTFMPFIFRAITRALAGHPQFNAAVDGTDIVFKQDINLGIAVATENGLIVPVIHGADKKSLVELTLAANDLAERARTKKLKPDDVARGTFTITNPGVYGSLFGTPIINQPQVAILCVGTIEKRPIVVENPEGGDALGIRTMCYLALTYDHRIIDGADAEVFMGEVLTTLRTDDWSELVTLDD